MRRSFLSLFALLAAVASSGCPSHPLEPSPKDGGGSPDDGLSVEISPATVNVKSGAHVQFTAQVRGDTRGVTWALEEPAGGTVDSAGAYRAPAPAGVYHVVASSMKNPLKKARATVNLELDATAATDVYGTKTIQRFHGGVMTPEPADLSSVSVVVLKEDPGDVSGYRRYVGTGFADGTFSVQDVPPGPYLLRLGSDVSFGYDNYDLLTSHYVELVRATVGRSQPELPDAGTKLALAVTGMSPFDADADDVQVTSEGAGFNYGSLTLTDASIDGGATALATTIDYPNFVDVNGMKGLAGLIDGSQGDVVYVSHLAQPAGLSADFYSASVIKESFQTSQLNMQNGATSTLSGTFQRLPTQTFTATLPRAAWSTLAHSVNSHAALQNELFDLDTLSPDALEALPFGSYDLIYAFLKSGTTDVSLRLDYGNPFPGNWTKTGYCEAAYGETVSYMHSDGDPHVATSRGYLRTADTLANLQAHGFEMPLTPPSDFRLDGIPATGASPMTGVSETPTLTWSPPATGSPTDYAVEVVSFYENIGLPNTYRLTAFRVRMDAATRALKLPGGILKAGGAYFILVKAYSEPMGEVPFYQRRIKFPFNEADAMSAVIVR